MNEMYIVPCGKKKIWDKDSKANIVKSKDLYIGSFTRKCIEYAEKFHKTSYFILSAKYGLLQPEEIVSGPYNQCFHSKESKPISKEILKVQIENRNLDKYDKIIILGGKLTNH